MNVWKCKCGKKIYWESGMTPQDCEGCEECYETDCCRRGPITSENYCPNCGRKIIKFNDGE